MTKNETTMESRIYFHRRVEEVIDDILREAAEECVGENKIECVGAFQDDESLYDYFICAFQGAPAMQRSTALRELPGAWAHLSEMRDLLHETISAFPVTQTSTLERRRRKYVNTAFWLPQGNETVIIDVSVPASHLRHFQQGGANPLHSAMQSLAKLNENTTPLYSVRLVLFPKFEEVDEAPAAA